jgi:transcriptional regulator with XRE-family HTH domain
MKLSQQIYTLRIARGMSQGDLADALEVSRQSVSKWETEAAVPDLDKLFRMSELFGVTLDELVRGESITDPPAAPPPQPSASQAPAAPMAPPAEISMTQRVLGFCLLGFAALTWLLVTLLGDFLAGLCLALPFLVFGIIFLRVHQYAWLVCAWIIYYAVNLATLFIESAPFFSLLTLNSFFASFQGKFTIWHLLSLAVALAFVVLCIITVYLQRRQIVPATRKNIMGLCAMMAVSLLAFLSIYAPLDSRTWGLLLLIAKMLLHYAGQMLGIMSIVRVCAMVRYHKKK